MFDQAGEDLEEIEEDEDEDEEAPVDDDGEVPGIREQTVYAGTSLLSQTEAGRPSVSIDVSSSELQKSTEQTPLLRSSTGVSRSRSRRRRSRSTGPHGDATVLQAVLMV